MNKDIDKKDHFIFKGFLPQDSLQEQCRDMYNLVVNKSPNLSAKEVSITKVGNNYEAKLKIISGSCNFEISSKESKASETVDELYKQFLSKIVKWNKHRNYFF